MAAVIADAVLAYGRPRLRPCRPGSARTRTLTWVDPNPNPDQVLAERPEGGWPGENYRPRLGDHRAYSGDGGRGACAVM
eukprot:scaffold30865_cov46-Phaeocystis_antarctica.AAC.2